MLAEQRLEELALLRPLSDDTGPVLARMHIHFSARNIDVSAQHDFASFIVQRLRPRRELRHEFKLGRIVLPAIGHVDRSEHDVAQRHLHDASLHVEVRMGERGVGFDETFFDVQRHAGVPLGAVPVRVVVGELALFGNLRRLGFQLLQTHHVRLIARHPLAYLRLPRTDAIDVPGCDLHVLGLRLEGLG